MSRAERSEAERRAKASLDTERSEATMVGGEVGRGKFLGKNPKKVFFTPARNGVRTGERKAERLCVEINPFRRFKK